MTMPLTNNCPFEREIGDDCFRGYFDENGNFYGEWRCVNYDPVIGCGCHQ